MKQDKNTEWEKHFCSVGYNQLSVLHQLITRGFGSLGSVLRVNWTIARAQETQIRKGAADKRQIRVITETHLKSSHDNWDNRSASSASDVDTELQITNLRCVNC